MDRCSWFSSFPSFPLVLFLLFFCSFSLFPCHLVKWDLALQWSISSIESTWFMEPSLIFAPQRAAQKWPLDQSKIHQQIQQIKESFFFFFFSTTKTQKQISGLNISGRMNQILNSKLQPVFQPLNMLTCSWLGQKSWSMMRMFFLLKLVSQSWFLFFDNWLLLLPCYCYCSLNQSNSIEQASPSPRNSRMCVETSSSD